MPFSVGGSSGSPTAGVAAMPPLGFHSISIGTLDFAEEMDIRAQNARALLDLAEKYKVPIEMLWKPSGGIAATPVVGEIEDPPALTGVRQPG